MRNGADHAAPDESRYSVRVMQGTVLAHEPAHGTGEAVLDRRAVVVQQPGQGPDLPVPARVADGDLAAQPARAVLRLPVRASHAGRGRDVGEDQPRSHLVSAGAAAKEFG